MDDPGIAHSPARTGTRGLLWSIVPPYLLAHIAETGSPEERAIAARTLALSETLRAQRQAAPPVAASAAGLTGSSLVRVYDAGGTTTLPGRLARDDADPPTGDLAVDEAHDGLQATLDLYREAFDRDSLDDQGLDLVASVHYGRDYDNAAWTGTQMIFGDGDGTLFNRFTVAVDVMGHELTHGMTQHTAGLEYQGQSGALNEHVSDVFGAMVAQHQATPQQTAEEADWLIGKGLFAPGINGVALRSMKAPGTAYDDPRLGKDPQPDHMDGYVADHRRQRGRAHQLGDPQPGVRPGGDRAGRVLLGPGRTDLVRHAAR